MKRIIFTIITLVIVLYCKAQYAQYDGDRKYDTIRFIDDTYIYTAPTFTFTNGLSESVGTVSLGGSSISAYTYIGGIDNGFRFYGSNSAYSWFDSYWEFDQNNGTSGVYDYGDAGNPSREINVYDGTDDSYYTQTSNSYEWRIDPGSVGPEGTAYFRFNQNFAYFIWGTDTVLKVTSDSISFRKPTNISSGSSYTFTDGVQESSGVVSFGGFYTSDLQAISLTGNNFAVGGTNTITNKVHSFKSDTANSYHIMSSTSGSVGIDMYNSDEYFYNTFICSQTTGSFSIQHDSTGLFYSSSEPSFSLMTDNHFTTRNYVGSVSGSINIGSIADNDATPDMTDNSVFIYSGSANSVVLTDLDNPVVGSIIRIIGNSDTYTISISDGGNFNLSAAWTGGLDDVITLFVQADNDYIEISRSDN